MVTESLVVEGEKSSLVAYVQLNEEKIAEEVQKNNTNAGNSAIQQLQTAVTDAVSGFADAVAYKQAEILNEIKFFVNSNVNKISRIDRIEQVEMFEKTASQKIKRYLYSITNFGKKDTDSANNAKENGKSI